MRVDEVMNSPTARSRSAWWRPAWTPRRTFPAQFLESVHALGRFVETASAADN